MTKFPFPKPQSRKLLQGRRYFNDVFFFVHFEKGAESTGRAPTDKRNKIVRAALKHVTLSEVEASPERVPCEKGAEVRWLV